MDVALVYHPKGTRGIGVMILVSAVLHLTAVYMVYKPPKIFKGSGAEMQSVEFMDVRERPSEAEVAPPTPAVAPKDLPPVDMSQAKIDESKLDMEAAPSGDVLLIGGKQKSLDELLSDPTVDARPGGRGRAYAAVPFWKVEVKPKPIDIPVPTYPEMVRSAGIEGSVVVEALVNIDGSIVDARILKSSGNAALDTAAVNAALKAKFTPAKQRDKPVRVWVSIPFRFTLQ